jgi:hypothetical protein
MLKISIIFLSNDFRTKNRQFFFLLFSSMIPKKTFAYERLIKEYNIGGLTFFHSRASATNYETKKNCIQ